jgi:hypothetical protein
MKRVSTMNQEKISDTLQNLPEVEEKLKSLFTRFNTLGNILNDPNAAKLYHHLMLIVIRTHEYDLGNYKKYGFNYTLNKDWDDIQKEYGGTVLLPLL